MHARRGVPCLKKMVRGVDVGIVTMSKRSDLRTKKWASESRRHTKKGEGKTFCPLVVPLVL